MAIIIINRSRYNKTPYDVLFQPLANEPILLITEYLEGFEGKFPVVERIERFRRNGNVELRALELGQQHPITHVVATSEYDLLRAAQLREHFGIGGQGVASAMAFRDKVLMKELASKVVDVPRNRRITSVLDIHEFIQSVGYPVVIKPVDGAGSLNTFVLKDRSDLVRFLDRCELWGYEIEEFVKGQMYTVDGLYHRGEVVLSWTSRYVNDCLSFHQGIQASMVQLADGHPLQPRLNEFVARLFREMPMPELTTFHAEVFHTEADRLVLCEVASRTGGGAINELGLHRFGFNMHHAWIKAQGGLLDDVLQFRSTPKAELFGFAQVPPRVGTLVGLPEQLPFDWVAEYLPEAVLGKKFEGLAESSDKVAVVVVRGATEEEVVKRMSVATEWMNQNCRWEP
ncbi:ATP-grasp domain-containing protein [Archangium sp.]|uniref:ATP-grasp domain-containing protein n=1 Tax=Archangium sp. TaxID=1872627 RepID=UPI00286D0651|nr:ATP-grasp domain-containing protein [Archangium sp.]